MSIRVALQHKTAYRYDRFVTLSPHLIRLRPAPHSRTKILSYSLKVSPSEHFLNWQQDPYSNYMGRIVFNQPTKALEVQVDLHAELCPFNPFDFFIEESAENYPFRYDEEVLTELIPYLELDPVGPKLQEVIDEHRSITERMVDYLVRLNQAISQRVQYTIRMEPGVQSAEETLTCGSGSCRDSAWLLVQLCRNLGLAARFVSGYLIQLVADEKPLNGPEGPTQDFTDLHAWTEVYMPGAGWIGLDPTSGLFTAEGHIPLACTAVPQTAAPISGAMSWEKSSTDEDDQLQEDFQFSMTVQRIVEPPRVTKPYTENQWHFIDQLGEQIDRELEHHDVRLTMGGEPTFVSIDNRDADEWNTTALGEQKYKQACELMRRLRDCWASNALLHFGQGKWYPGESLPRWTLGCYWRTDGEPIWQNSDLYADQDRADTFTIDDAERFMKRLTAQLQVDSKFAMPGYEDVWHYLWKERRLPTNVDPLENRLDNPEDRARLAKIFENQLSAVVGYALPLRATGDTKQPWQSGEWFFRQEHMFLFPGDSPMGFRLPLDSLPWEPKGNRQVIWERDPFAPRQQLPAYANYIQQTPIPQKGSTESPKLNPNGASRNGQPYSNGVPKLGTPESGVIRTALCVEPRHGKLHIFMPPLERLEDYLALVAAVEVTATELQIPVLIEGYRPPSDHRVLHFSITPDPGVIEVNVHPSQTWRELEEKTTTLYEQARLSRLSTEKFMVDGRHVGTGGGNHMVLGSHSPADSPFLRRPDLLRSLVTFWNNHPSLSYLFSGMFVGPTSQHPRVDEARHDALYELEIACQQLPHEKKPPAWLVDRAFRHLLTDVTGNTHRTEFCIDKMFSPDSAEGRRGLLELRAFEMPPHAQMSLVQQLLLRSLMVLFWKQPYQAPLVRWGTELHDRFMLPHFVEQDFQDILDELSQGGYEFDPSWFAPHIEFKFPLLGEVTYRGVNLELRMAVEPWHVLGEEAAAGGTARYVDSSLERVQLRVRGWTDPRHVLTCNGRRLPLHATGTGSEFVAGVRYRAWQPPSCLHPMIPVHTPLVFEIFDTWNQRSLGGCTYHVSHPGGRFYDSFPVNALEAESRRISRFEAFGHSPGPIAIPPVESNPVYPYTLDLRQPQPESFSPPGWLLNRLLSGRQRVPEKVS